MTHDGKNESDPRFPLIRSWLDRLKPKPAPPTPEPKRTWGQIIGDWIADKTWGAFKCFWASVFEFIARQLRRKK